METKKRKKLSHIPHSDALNIKTGTANNVLQDSSTEADREKENPVMVSDACHQKTASYELCKNIYYVSDDLVRERML